VDRFVKQLKKIAYYASNGCGLAVPRWWYQRQLPALLEAAAALDAAGELSARLDYYHRLVEPFSLGGEGIPIRSISGRKHHTYYFDLMKTLRYFPRDCTLCYRFGDVTEVPRLPSVVKSRPIGDHNQPSVLLKLNRLRHYRPVRDQLPYAAKRDQLVWRGKCRKKPTRIAFVKAFGDHPLCDVGSSDPEDQGQSWYRPFMNVGQQLDYKFILSIEGNDVATNLKWILASNSLCLMTRPRYETWFMEGCLIPGHHYVQLAEDYSDLEAVLEHYIRHPDEAQAIIRNANAHAAQFRDQRREALIEVLVMQRYFALSGHC
jgi:hypothetical protein